ncbi:MAG: SpoIIE family protein phosphatase [Chlorobiaceae bacterium]|nr:SpoIIE family protein phosphatase [Chlorobiaceae bacterium]
MKTREELVVLFVDDESDILNSLNRFLRKAPFKRLFAESASAALELFKGNKIDLVVSDLRMPGMNGLELINEIKRQRPETVRMILSGSQDIDHIISAINTGEVFRFIPKPVDPDSFKQILNDAIDYYCLKIDREELFNELSVKNSQLIEANQSLIKLAADLERSTQQIKSMNDAAHDAVFMLDENGRIIYRNASAESMFGYTKTECPTQSFSELFAKPSDEIDLNDLIKHVPDLTGKCCENQVHQVEGIRKDGLHLPLEISKGCVHLDTGMHSVLIARDISTRIEEEKSRVHYEEMQKELESEIEKKLLQNTWPITLRGAEISCLMLSSGHIDGDFTELIEYNPHQADMLIGDVMGHGIQPALVAAGIKSLFLKTIAQQRESPDELPALQRIVSTIHDRCIHELIELGVFATLLFVRLEPEKKVVSMIDCGHNPLIHLQFSSCRCKLIKGDNLPMGMIEEEDYHETRFPVENKDLVILFSDGITECRAPDESMFGIERLTSLIEQNAGLPTEEIIGKIHQSLSEFCKCSNFEDDVTCIVIRFLDENENHIEVNAL